MFGIAIALSCLSTPQARSEQLKLLVGHIQADVGKQGLKDRTWYEEHLISEVKKCTKGYSITSTRDLESQIKYQHMRDTMGCDTQSCLAEIAGATGADLILFPRLFSKSGSYAFSLVLIKQSQAEVVGRSGFQRFKWSEDSFEKAISKAVTEVFGVAAPTVAPRQPQASVRVDSGALPVLTEVPTPRRPELAELKASCVSGSGSSCVKLGDYFQSGHRKYRLRKNLTAAGALFRRARELFNLGCDAGRQDDCVALALLLWGAKGGSRDSARARGLFEVACDTGLGSACNHLGWMYERGVGGATDHNASKRLFTKACELGHQESCPWALR